MCKAGGTTHGSQRQRTNTVAPRPEVRVQEDPAQTVENVCREFVYRRGLHDQGRRDESVKPIGAAARLWQLELVTLLPRATPVPGDSRTEPRTCAVADAYAHGRESGIFEK